MGSVPAVALEFSPGCDHSDGLFGFGGDRIGGRGPAKDVTGFEPARSTCSTCGGVGSLGDSKVGCCDFGIDNSLVHGGEANGTFSPTMGLALA